MVHLCVTAFSCSRLASRCQGHMLRQAYGLREDREYDVDNS